MKYVGSEEARQTLPALLERAHDGSPTVVTRHGKAFAAIVPLAMLEQGKVEAITALKGSGKGLWGEQVADELARLRGDWE